MPFVSKKNPLSNAAMLQYNRRMRDKQTTLLFSSPFFLSKTVLGFQRSLPSLCFSKTGIRRVRKAKGEEGRRRYNWSWGKGVYLPVISVSKSDHRDAPDPTKGKRERDPLMPRGRLKFHLAWLPPSPIFDGWMNP